MTSLGTVAAVCFVAFCVFAHQAKVRKQQTGLDLALQFDLSLAAERFRQKSGLSEEETERVELEFRRFFLLMAESSRLRFGLHNGPIDDFWHELICCTELYADFCVQVAGRFIHHDPRGGSGDGYARTWWAYHDRFGLVPDPLFWPTPEPADRPNTASTDAGCGGSSSCSGGCCGGSGCSGGCGGH